LREMSAEEKLGMNPPRTGRKSKRQSEKLLQLFEKSRVEERQSERVTQKTRKKNIIGPAVSIQ